MQPFRVHPASCSCTGCVYRSRSKEPNIQQIIQGGSEIDKLFYGKFLPLRERKLLEKLIRTRDVYDDVRNQLLSSASSDQTSREHKKKTRNDSITDNSSTVLEMVDRVDRGRMGSGHTSNLNSCCSCCSCETLRKIRKRMEKDQRKHPHPCFHRHIVTCEDIAKYCAEAEERGRKRRRKLSTQISSKIGSASLKIKKHLSEPCACAALSVSSVSTHASKALRDKIRSKKKAKETDISRKVTIDQKSEIAKASRKPRQKAKNIQSSTTKDSGTELRSPIAFKIKKDSLILFKEKLLKKRTYDDNQDVECKPGTCDVGECMAEDCFKHIKAKDGTVKRKRKTRSRHSDTERDRSYVSERSRTKKVKVRESKVQHEPACPCPHGPCICESKKKSFYSMSTMLKKKIEQSVSKLDINGKKSKPRQKLEKATKLDKSSSYVSESSRTEKVKVRESKVQHEPACPCPHGPCLCKSKRKSFYSMSKMLKKKIKQSVSKLDINGKKPKPRQKLEKATKLDKSSSYVSESSRTEKVKVRESKVQHEPACPCPHGPCLCKSKRKSFYSMSTMLKKKIKQSVSKLDINGKKPKPRQKLEKATKLAKSSSYVSESSRTEKVKVRESKVQHEPACPCPHGPCLCKSKRKSFYSMSTMLKKKIKQSVSKLDINGKKPKPRQKLEKATKLAKSSSYVSESSRTEKFKVRESKVQHEPACPCPHGPCLCESKRKSFYSMSTNLKNKIRQSVSKLDIKGKKPKPRQKLEKATKLDKLSKLTKSSTSMTSVPKSKTKAQSVIREEKTASKSKPKAKLQLVAKDKGLEEKEKVLVQVSPKSELGNINCECKPSTKSTPSVIPSPKQKVSKSGPTPSALREISRQKPKRESHQNLDEADLQELKGHVKAKREKRMKPTHGKIKQHKKHEHNKTQAKASQESYLRESSSQASEFYGGKLLPFPRECEPLMCIPYECDPEKCAEILLSRSKSRGKSAKTSTDRLRRKSVGSAAFSQRTSSRSRSKSKHNESKSADSVLKKTKYVSKEPPPEIVEKNTGAESYHPDRQAVKISSSFSFNIEFYKDTFPGEECECVEKVDKNKSPISDHQNKIKQKEHRRKYKDHGTRYSSSKDRGTGDSSSRYNISSQSSSSQSSKNIQVGHKLKRCFCTLKLLQKKKQKITHAVSKKTMASLQNKELEMGPRKKRTQTKRAGKAYVVPPATSLGSSLLPYECEPDFCTPGECNPYECAERIKQRNRRAGKHVSKETNTAVTPKVSAFTSQSVSKSSRKIQSAEDKKVKQKERHSQSRNIEPKVSADKFERHADKSERQAEKSERQTDKSEKQVVRIGSNLSFNFEFSKSNINDDTTANVISDIPRKKERKHLHQKGIKVKPRVHHEASETTTDDVKTKQTYTEPFLQRCLCTLKLMKKNKKKVEALSPWQNRNEYVMHMQNESVTTNRAEISYNHGRSKMLPDEYGSGLCPYPYNYDKFIKLRQMRFQNKYSNKVDFGSRPTFSKTITSSKSRNSQSLTEHSHQKVKKINRDYYETNMPSKQRFVRVGSNLSNNVINKRTHNKDKLNTIGFPIYIRPPYHKSIEAEANSKEKNNSVVSTIKRYFSTLKFQNKLRLKNKTNEINERIKTSYPVPNLQQCDYHPSRTRLSKYHYDLSSHDCVPNSCKPVMCHRYECYEEYKRRKSKGLHDHYASTNKRERISTLNVTRSDFTGSTNVKNTHSKLLRHKRTKEQSVGDKQKYMKGAVSFSRSRQAVRKVSDLCFNEEFSKNRFVSFVQDNDNRKPNRGIKKRAEKYNILSEISTVNTLTNKGTEDKHVASKDCISQANKLRKEAKTSNVGFLLKRCLCTLGLQKKNLPKSQFHWQQPITTQFVQVEHNVTKSGPNAFDKTMYGGKPLKSTLPERGHVFRENYIGNQNGMKTSHHYGPQNIPNSNSYSRRVHIRSSIDLSFDKMKCLLNPFYKSFYALNVKISKAKNKPQEKYRAINENEREPGDCKPKECDPVECSTRLKRLKRFKLAMKPKEKPDTECYERCKEQFQNKKKDKSEDKPLILGSDMSIRAGVYKDKDPYKNKRHQAIRVGSDVSVNFDFFKEPHTRTMCVTGPLPPKQGRRAARPKRWPEDTDSKASVISHMMQKCFCSSKLKKAYGTKSEINQNKDVVKAGKPCTCQRRKSTTRLLRRKQNSLKSKSVQYEDYTQKPHKHFRKKDRNNVRFCTDVNCLEYYDGQKQRIGRGDGDAEKRHGPEPEKTSVVDKYSLKKKKTPKGPEKRKKKLRKRTKRKKRKLKVFIDKCYCHIKKGKKLGQKPSMERIGPYKKTCKQLDRAEREMETIMPYSKNKFKKIDSQPELGLRKQVCPKCRTDSVAGIPTDTDESKDSENTCLCPRPLKHTDTFSCECNVADKCPVCRAKEAGTYSRKRFMRKPCTCMEEPKKEEPKKDLSKCPMCKQNYKKGVSTCPCCKKPFAAGAGGGRSDAAAKKKQLDLNKPLFQMTVNKTNMRIVNKDEVIKKMGSSAKAMQKAQKALDSSNYHSSKCKCCICRAKRKGQRQAGPTFSVDARKLKPCICGSVVCKKDWEKIKQEQRSRAAVKIKKCVCGSNICGEESQKMPEMLLEAAKQAEHDKEMARRAQLKEQQYQAARKKRIKDREKALKKTAKLRKKDDKYEMRSIKQNINAGDIALVAESLIDLGTFGSKAFCDIAKYVYKGVLHPRDAISDVKDAISDPGQAMKTMAKSAEVMGLNATINRIKARFQRMPVATTAVSAMESNATTNYLLHMADRNPKQRMKTFKKKRYREPLDFQCSLYMASMRRRPCLRVYYMCPWFYPHFMSMLQLWKQFMDIFLFVFAVLVWSPCILCMEICRGCVCCLMCQG